MKKLINRLTCLFRGHEWKIHTIGYWGGYGNIEYGNFKCARCGKIKEEVI